MITFLEVSNLKILKYLVKIKIFIIINILNYKNYNIIADNNFGKSLKISKS